jgi:hypothetical protein
MSQLRTNSIVPAGGIPAGASGGGIIQVVYVQTSTQTSTTSTTFADATNVQATITPSSSNSKILVLLDVNIRTQSNDRTVGGARILRGSTEIYLDDFFYEIGVNANVGVTQHASFNYLDAPNTTNPTTYKLQIRRVSAAGTGYPVIVNAAAAAKTSITLMEISA